MRIDGLNYCVHEMQFLPYIFKGKKGASLNLIFEIMTLQAVYRLVTSLRGVKFEEDEGVWHSNHHFSLVFSFCNSC